MNYLALFCTSLIFLGGISIFVLAEDPIQSQDTITFSISPITIEEKDMYIELNFKESNSYLIEENKPLLPIIEKTIVYPYGTIIDNISISSSTKNEIKLESKIIPSPKMQVLNQNNSPNQPFSYDEGQYPNKWFDYRIGLGLHDGQHVQILTLYIYPIQYFPQNDIIKTTNFIELQIKYHTNSQFDFSSKDSYDLLIIAPSEFHSNLIPLKIHKDQNNIYTKIISLQDINNSVYFPLEGRDNAEQIKYFIKNAIENWGIQSVLLVGGIDNITARETHIYLSTQDDEIFVSDLYYADIYNNIGGFSSWDSNNNSVFAEYNWNGNTDEMDLYPDVNIGRLACINNSQVQTVVNKIIDYETNKSYTKNWFTTMIGVGGDTFVDDNDNIDEGEYANDYNFNIMDGFVPIRLWASNGVLGGSSPDGVTAINNALDNGAGFVEFSGHGNTFSFATHPHCNANVWVPFDKYKNTDIASLENNEKLPIIITCACSVGKYNNNPNCFSWSFVSSPNGGGIASCGPSALGYGYVGTYVVQGLIERMAVNMFTAFDEGVQTFGEMVTSSINDYISPSMTGVHYKTVLAWHAFGDPTLIIRENSIAPETPNIPIGPINGIANSTYTYSTNTTENEQENIYYLFDWDDNSYSGWIGPYQSEQDVIVSHKWTISGNYSIRVKAKDVHNVQSNWSDPLLITITPNPQPSIIWIDDDYNASTPGWNITRFNIIQNGIDAVAENGTIYVYNGTYYENIIINKSVILNGENNTGTIIDGNNLNNTIITTKDNVIINNVKITNGTNVHSYKSAGVLINSNHNQIINCNISYNNYIGISINHSSYNNITGNIFYNNKDQIGNSRSIFIYYSPNNIITNNIIYSNTTYNVGIGLNYYSSINNIINNNSLLGTTGISINGAPQNVIKNNTFEKNGIYISGPLSSWNSQTIHDNFVKNKPIYYYKNSESLTIPLDAGQVILANCHNFTIKNLQISNMHNGIALGFSTNNIIDNNTITSSLFFGINLWGSTNNTITNNTINSSKFFGILIWQSTSYTLIKNNIIYGSGSEGISLKRNTHNSVITNNEIKNNSPGISIDASSNNTIIENLIQNNQYSGIYIWIANGPCENNIIYHNNLINNILNAHDGGNDTWDNGYPSGGNYYDDYTGIDTNGDGIGETPYIIDGGNNQDNYPFTDPFGWLIELDINQSTHDRGFPIRHAADGDWAGAQNFLPTLKTLTKAEIYLRKFGTPEFNLTVELCEDTIDGQVIDTLIFTPEEVPSTWTWLELDFNDVTVTPGVDYFIKCPPAPSGVTTSFGYEWGYAFGNQYDDGSFWFTRDGGNLWRNLPTMYEFVFRSYGYD